MKININLSPSDKYYISKNKNKSLSELAFAIEKDEKLIKAYLISLSHKEEKKKNKKNSSLFKAFDKKKGAVSLTAEALIASEQLEKENINNHRHRGIDGKDITTIRDSED